MLPATGRVPRFWPALLIVGLSLSSLSLVAARAAGAQDDKNVKDKRANLTLKAAPTISFSPSRIVVTAELKGGSSDTDEYYCPSLEWDWGDDTQSEATSDCEPFQAGTSTIQRRWTASHTFNTGGVYRITLRLKRSNKVVVAGNSTVQVRAGLRDQSDF
jgi:hypothetical protein